jgi:hypothetical protein
MRLRPVGGWSDYLPPLLLFVLAAAFLWQAGSFNPASREVPQLVGWVMLVLTALDFVTRLPTKFGIVVARMLNPSALSHFQGAVSPDRTRRQLVAVVALVVLTLAMLAFGILPCLPIFAFPALRFGARCGWLGSAAGAVLLTLGIWALFAKLLGLELYPGMLFDPDA